VGSFQRPDGRPEVASREVGGHQRRNFRPLRPVRRKDGDEGVRDPRYPPDPLPDLFQVHTLSGDLDDVIRPSEEPEQVSLHLGDAV